jgi:hypothetical protein
MTEREEQYKQASRAGEGPDLRLGHDLEPALCRDVGAQPVGGVGQPV